MIIGVSSFLVGVAVAVAVVTVVTVVAAVL